MTRAKSALNGQRAKRNDNNYNDNVSDEDNDNNIVFIALCCHLVAALWAVRPQRANVIAARPFACERPADCDRAIVPRLRCAAASQSESVRVCVFGDAEVNVSAN